MNGQLALECILIADDLTGACDTGVQFARRGFSSEVWVDPSHAVNQAAEVVAFNTGSRGDEITAARVKIRRIADLCSDIKPKILFKKIDSTLRGNVGQEVAATMRCFRRDCAIVAPAFPAMGRTVRNGILEWKDCSGAGGVDIQELLEQQGIPPQRIVRASAATHDAAGFEALLRTSNANPGMFILVDSAEQEDLRILVSRAYHLKQHLLWVGAAGLGMALARKLGNSTPKQSATLSKDASVLFWIGSMHPVTQLQRDVLLKDSAGIEVVAEPGTLAIARRAIQEKRILLLKIEREHARHSLDAFLNGLKDLSIAGMLFTGGDTAMLVCNCLGANAIRLVDEIAPGIPWGNLCGGSFDGLPVATKAGGFGDRDALLRCEEFFGSSRKVMA